MYVYRHPPHRVVIKPQTNIGARMVSVYGILAEVLYIQRSSLHSIQVALLALIG